MLMERTGRNAVRQFTPRVWELLVARTYCNARSVVDVAGRGAWSCIITSKHILLLYEIWGSWKLPSTEMWRRARFGGMCFLRLRDSLTRRR